MAVSAEVARLFLEELARRNIAVVMDEKGDYVLAIPEKITNRGAQGVEVQCRTLTVHLENLSRDYQNDPDPQRIVHFVETCTAQPTLPAWKEARSRIRWQAETADNALGKTIIEKVSRRVVRALVYVDPSEMHIIWLNPDLIKRWRKKPEELWAVAATNMERIISAAKLDLTADRGHKIGMISTELTGFKAALLFSPRLRELVEPELGWPVLAVAPCRDFVYVFGVNARELFDKIGGITIEQYSEGGYPISTEVFEIGAEGVEALGEFQRPPQTSS